MLLGWGSSSMRYFPSSGFGNSWWTNRVKRYAAYWLRKWSVAVDVNYAFTPPKSYVQSQEYVKPGTLITCPCSKWRKYTVRNALLSIKLISFLPRTFRNLGRTNQTKKWLYYQIFFFLRDSFAALWRVLELRDRRCTIFQRKYWFKHLALARVMTGATLISLIKVCVL